MSIALKSLGTVMDSAALFAPNATLEVRYMPGSVQFMLVGPNGCLGGVQFANRASLEHLKRVIDLAAEAAGVP